VFENWVLRTIFGPKKDEVPGSWRKLHHEELHNLHPLPHTIAMIKEMWMKWTGHVESTGKMKNAYKIVIINSEEKRQLTS
jgi:hypothetical protein